MVAIPLGRAYNEIPSVLSSVTGTFKGSVYPKAAWRSQSVWRSPKQSPFTAHDEKDNRPDVWMAQFHPNIQKKHFALE